MKRFAGVISSKLNGNDEQSGAQIDLLIDRRDKTINLCEIKFSSKEFEIDKNYDLNLKNKYSNYVGKVIGLDDLFTQIEN